MDDKRGANFDAFRATEGRHLSEFEAAKAFIASVGNNPSLKRQAQAQILLPALLPPQIPEPKVVLLVHGILTTAEWQQQFEHELRMADPEAEVYPVTSDFVHLIPFLFPWGTRQRFIKKIRAELLTAREVHPGAKIMVVAHSFGTYIVTHLLQSDPSLKIDRLVLCGAIVRRDYDWHKVSSQLVGGRVVNDMGTRDIWPIVAKQVTSGYGDSGRFGFGTIPVVDRWFKYRHSDFFRPLHYRKYWIPYLTRGQIVPSPFTRRRPKPQFWQVAIPYKWIIFLVALAHFGGRFVL